MNIITGIRRVENLNSVNLIGRIGKDIEVRYTQNNTPVANFSLAIPRRFAKNGETDWVNIVACVDVFL